ncbi:hypothetical protein [Bradyrhizobium vignae]|nr:hypothetical protein [Bradyrhizobium vignae]
MKTPDDVAEMLRRACGWGVKRIARRQGRNHYTVKDYRSGRGEAVQVA